jgi:hypothetical protein
MDHVSHGLDIEYNRRVIKKKSWMRQNYYKASLYDSDPLVPPHSLLCSSVAIKDLAGLCQKDNSIAYAYFFFDGRDSQKELQLHESLIKSLIQQFFDQIPGSSIPPPLIDLYGKGHHQPSIDSLHGALKRILQQFRRVYVVIDSLDECTERERLLEWLESIASWEVGKPHLLVMSRLEQDIRERMQPLSPRLVSVTEQSQNRDIEMYLDFILQIE